MAEGASSSNAQNDGDENIVLFPVVPLLDCPHLVQVEPLPEEGLQVPEAVCVVCQSNREPWCCLSCYTITCSRHVNGHAMVHFESSGHSMALSYSDLSVWCYMCNAYVHNPVLIPAKNAAHVSKFGEPDPSYAAHLAGTTGQPQQRGERN